MNDASATEIGAWVTTAGLAGAAELDLLHGFCERAAAAGLPLARAVVFVDTLHPIYEGRVFRWSRDAAPDERTVGEYGRTSEGGEAAQTWRRSPFYRLLETGGSVLRSNLARGDPADFAIVEELRSQGQTDYLALIHRFAAGGGVIGEMDCVYILLVHGRALGLRGQVSDNIEGKVVVVTGASSGLGEATTRFLSAQGASVVLSARRVDRIQSLADELAASGGKALAVATDVTHCEQVKKLVDAAVQTYGRIDVMLNNAELMPQAPLERLKVDEWDRMIDVNIKGVATDHQESTMRRRARILMDVHPGLRLGGCWRATNSLPGLLRMNNLHSNHS